jgi:hypothetical protein
MSCQPQRRCAALIYGVVRGRRCVVRAEAFSPRAGEKCQSTEYIACEVTIFSRELGCDLRVVMEFFSEKNHEGVHRFWFYPDRIDDRRGDHRHTAVIPAAYQDIYNTMPQVT